MRNFIFIILLFSFSISNLKAQTKSKKIIISGIVLDKEDSSPVIQSTIQLLSLPSKRMITGTVSNNDGKFSISASSGNYELQISFVGYKTITKDVTLSANKPVLNLGKFELESDAIMLKGAIVTAEAPQVSVKEDTLVYNSSAFRTPEGSMLEELVKKLPGAEVDDDGNIKINGKEIKKIMVDGKEFFGGDVATGLKNLPVDMIENIKSYDKQSDLARITGIEDGEEETVLDLTVKKGMNKGWFGNIDLAKGTKNRYIGKAMVNYFKDKTQFSVISDLNNVNDQRFSGGGPRWRKNNGLHAKRTIGANFATETNKLDAGGSIRYNYSDADIISRGYSERFIQSGNSFLNTNSMNRNKSENFNADFRLEWKPNDKTNIIFRPNFTIGNNNNFSSSESGTFNQDPFGEEYNGLNPNYYLKMNMINDPFDSIRVNLSNSLSKTKANSKSGNAMLQINRKLNDKGRNITFQGKFGFGDNDNDRYLESKTLYYLTEESDLIRNQYITTPSNQFNYSAKIRYTEPILKNAFLQFGYSFYYKYTQSNKKTYTMPNDWTLTSALPEDYLTNEDFDLSKDANYKYFNHNIHLSLRLIEDNYQLSFGTSLKPQHTILSYKKGYNSIDTVRNVLNFSPNLNFRYKFSKTSQLEITYNGTNNQPQIENLLPIIDNSNPLNIIIGNPGLKPSFRHEFKTFFNTYNAENQRGIMTSFSFNATQNEISTSTKYNTETGGKTSTYENINGNWNTFGMFGINSALKNKKITIGSFSRAFYNNRVAFLYDNNIKDNQKNTSTNLLIGEKLNATYRNDWFEFTLNGTIDYNWEKNKLRPEYNQEPYTFSYGASTNITLPWNMSLSTNITNQSRRGYLDSSMNRNDLLWNAQISQPLLKGAAILSFEMYDILKQQTNISRSLSADMRSVNEYNGINSYCMLHLVYRLNLFNGKQAGKRMESKDRYSYPMRHHGRGNMSGRRHF